MKRAIANVALPQDEGIPASVLFFCRTFEVESGASDPYLSGPMEIQTTPAGIDFRWSGSQEEFHQVPWYALMFLADETPDSLHALLEGQKEAAREQGFNEGIALAEAERLERIAAGRKVIATRLSLSGSITPGVAL